MFKLISFYFLLHSVLVSAAPIAEETLKLIKGSRFKPDHLGFYLYDLDEKKLIAAHNEQKLFVPASLVKIPSTLMSLETLGGDHKFKTHLKYRGTISKGVLTGDIFFIGGGDPFLTSSHLVSLAQKMRAMGILELKGNFYYVDEFLPNTSILNDDVPEDQTYNPGVSALSVDFNRFTLWQNGGRKSTYKNTFTAIPNIDSIVVVKSNTSLGPVTKLKPAVHPNKEVWTLSLKEKYSRSMDLPVRHPSLHAASLLKKFSGHHGVQLSSPIPWEKDLPRLSSIETLYSKPLINLVESTLEYSNNLLAELILLGAVKKWKGRVTKIENSGSILTDWLKKNVTSTNWDKVSLSNGSGLDYHAQISPENLAHILISTSNKIYGQRSYWSLLSTSGHKGWLNRRLRSPAYAYKLWGKTGSLDYVSNIAGYFISKDNKRIVFSLFVNDFEKREKLNTTAIEKTSYLRRKAVSWNRYAQNLQDTILKSWIDKL